MKDKFIPRSPIIYSAPMWLRVIAIVAFLATLVTNVYFGFGSFYSQVADEYSLFVNPPRWTFRIIWVIIYVFYAGTLIYVALKNRWPTGAYWASIGTNILTALWVGVFARGTLNSNLICLMIVGAKFLILYTLWAILYEPLQQSQIYLFARNVVSLYMGWILIVSVLHLGIVLVYSIGVPHKYFTIMFWIVVPLLFILVTWLAYLREKRYGLKTLIYFWIAGIWGMFGAFLSTYVNRQFI